jgi:hypothetical protein
MDFPAAVCTAHNTGTRAAWRASFIEEQRTLGLRREGLAAAASLLKRRHKIQYSRGRLRMAT